MNHFFYLFAQSSSCLPDRCFCEQLVNGWVRQPINAYSSLFYSLAGLMMLTIIVKRLIFKQTASRGKCFKLSYQLLFAGATIAVGLGSFLMHARFTLFTEFLDVQSMFLIVSFMFIYALFRHRWIRQKLLLPLYILINLAIFLVILTQSGIDRPAFAIMLYTILVFEIWLQIKKIHRQTKKYFYWCYAFLQSGYIIWILDNDKIWCRANSWLQGHSIWHLFGAIAALLIFLYYDSEQILL